MKKVILNLIVFLITISLSATEQSLVQNIKGKITDKDSKSALIGATVIIADMSPIKGTVSDLDGNFRFDNIPIGRHTIQISYVGYKPKTLEGIYLSSGKELYLNIELIESATQLKEAVIKANGNGRQSQPLNEMATISARSFSVEETGRYAAGAFDPARMVQSYAGVTDAGDDMRNEIVIRGNSPRGILWRLEGIEIPNPNHFGDFGSSGGAISMLSSSTLAQSDFYTGAFPAEYGNATAGVFDIRFRNGNQEKREYSFMIGILGIEASAEGYLKQGSKSSYLFNYRYSTLDVLSLFYKPLGDIFPTYQDLSFKVFIPTKNAGTFSIFGLGGKNFIEEPAIEDSSKWEYDWDASNYSSGQLVGAAGISNLYHIGKNTYIKSILACTQNKYTDESYMLIPENNYERKAYDLTIFDSKAIRFSTNLTHKINAKNTIRTGFIGTYKNFLLDYEYRNPDSLIWNKVLEQEGNYLFYQTYLQWKYKFNDNVQLNSGFHYSYLELNKTWSLEPRLSFKWNINQKNILSAAAGIHSKPEDITTYFAENKKEDEFRTLPNKNLEFLKSFHGVIGYEYFFSNNLRAKAEVYYQHLYDIPVENNDSSIFSTIDKNDVWYIIFEKNGFVNKGTGKNIGLDLTIEKSFSNNYYVLFSGSAYDSKYSPINNQEYNTIYNGNYSVKTLAGKEFVIGKKDNNVFGINGKAVLSGGKRYSKPIISESLEQQEIVFDLDNYNKYKGADYYRFDLGVYFKFNKQRITHTIMVDIQNVTNRLNEYDKYYYYDEENHSIENETWYQTGLFPIFNYRIEF
ncbi:carboxypeptidase-like regulatory domain-containing protein [Bacteroidota bacterium]